MPELSLGKDELLDSITQANFLGSGSNSRAYTTPDPDLIVLAPHRLNLDEARDAEITERPDPFPDHNFGQPVAHIGPVAICKRQHGLTPQSLGWMQFKVGEKEHPTRGTVDVTEQKYVFLPQDYSLSSAFHGSAVPVMTPIDHLDPVIVATEVQRRRAEVLDAIDAMPVEAYRQALQEMLIVHANEHMIDPSKPNNILINPWEQRFGWVDLNDFEKYPHQRPDNIEEVFPVYLPFMLSRGVQQNISIAKRIAGDPDPYNTDLNDRESEVLSRAFERFVAALEQTPSSQWIFDLEDYYSPKELQSRYGFDEEGARQMHARLQAFINPPPPPAVNEEFSL
ncbi:MAG: hypothetical protein KDI65_11710 [Alphaproteobacteria bacterium]|nr:hypothetical protein [Alphaproteobacteria bacterium]